MKSIIISIVLLWSALSGFSQLKAKVLYDSANIAGKDFKSHVTLPSGNSLNFSQDNDVFAHRENEQKFSCR